MANSIIQYTSRTFEAILSDINSSSELVDKPGWWKNGIAGIGDVISMWNNAVANNVLLRTSYTRRNVQLLLELIDYYLSPQSTANGKVTFYIKDTAIFPFTVTQSDLVALTTGSLAVSSKRFEARGSETVTAINEIVSSANINATTNEWTVTREYTTGEKVRLQTTDTLPDPLLINTDYYVIKVDATTIKLAESLVDAINNNFISLVDVGIGSHTINLYSFQVQMYQQQSVSGFVVGQSDGVTEFQEFELADKNILKDTMEIVINSESYTIVDTWINSTISDRHCRLFYNTDNTARLQFGNGEFGVIPPAFDVNVLYAFGGGAESNVNALNKVNVYAGTDSNINGVSNLENMTGGENPENIESAKILGPILLKSRDRFVTAEDGEALSLAFGGVSLVKVISNAFGVLSAKVVGIASGGGQLSSTVQADLQQYLIDRTVLESIDVRVQDAVITPINVTSGAKLKPGYTWAGSVENYYRVAWKLFFSEAGYEIRQDYLSNGIASAVSLLNIIFTENFAETDYVQLQELIEELEPRDFNDEIQESDAFAYIAGNVFGVDYITITAPVFPVILALDEITTYGTLTLSEIL